MKKALKLFVSFLVFIIVSVACIALGFGALIGIVYVMSFLAKVAVLGVILKIIACVFLAMIVAFVLIGGTLDTYKRIFKRKHNMTHNCKTCSHSQSGLFCHVRLYCDNKGEQMREVEPDRCCEDWNDKEENT